MKAYTLKKKANTDELHLFEGDFIQPPCTSYPKSICKKMQKSDSEKNIFTCLDEEKARESCSRIGRQVCGTCVSHLYESYI